jgi:hypothetical protein
MSAIAGAKFKNFIFSLAAGQLHYEVEVGEHASLRRLAGYCSTLMNNRQLDSLTQIAISSMEVCGLPR